MSNVYYVTHPSIPLTATVDAPTTEKARTTFLDFLERSGTINRRDRRQVRKSIITKLMDPNEPIAVDIALYYNYVASKPSYVPQTSVTGNVPRPPTMAYNQEGQAYPYSQEAPVREEPITRPKVTSPLMAASLGKRGI
jgi:hypothetical protein